ncbi:hypothetical protein A3D01_04840 [Candidatus Woesebacteria bacterium RIFCSPHIGHO2_02_FULL_39_13]|uniref:Uncharacterized protein n=1 Tax=Candidatus Woesebacteria bacterium RIFCSPHIGHO2_02_FULL_39_13 TaxID=1802505 RepID=A0A1F7YZT2_9BACT|nr:MAG: hypothetical protein A2692_00160 [Candidatus Woesebacteria bacterium RIFCSPHIGHO2_01_FULL_39_95]OGM32873.1 MAG: hypothetical protein A3D01_04840 [Candidatus Woesebacteria bacterium RIFCSPHIGHO2_02_FULL_39_13]OGM74386.1 MAG: hypothetical protein A3H19_05150 [Candidatus Woesebacteria bacterium RIFCSPLOWO2_12_FULL_39_9]
MAQKKINKKRFFFEKEYKFNDTGGLLNIRRLINLGLVSIFFAFFIVLVVLQAWVIFTDSGLTVSPLIYWMLFLGLAAYVVKKSMISSLALKLALVLYIIASLFTIVGLAGVGEIFMKVSLITWIVGLGKALIEYKNVEGIDNNHRI